MSHPATSKSRHLFGFLALCSLWLAPPAWARQEEEPPAGGARHAVIIVGLPGDAEHQTRFEEIVTAWSRWLREDLGVAAEDLSVLSGRELVPEQADQGQQRPRSAATADSIRTEIDALNRRLHKNDSLWVFFLGHANYDDEHAFFHLPGPDINEDDVAELFAETKCREQLFWLTHACSGWFMKSLSRKERVVITATAADREYNETEFPAALATVCDIGTDQLDRNHDGKVSVAELFVMTVAAVESRFADDQRAPTEHAQLDDNGDGAGTESGKLANPDESAEDGPDVPVTGRVKAADGRLAANIILTSNSVAERTADGPASQN